MGAYMKCSHHHVQEYQPHAVARLELVYERDVDKYLAKNREELCAVTASSSTNKHRVACIVWYVINLLAVQYMRHDLIVGY